MNRAVFWILLFANVVLSVFVPVFIFPRFITKITSMETVIFALLSALVLFSIEIYTYVYIIYQIKSKEQAILNLDFDSDSKLFNIMQHIKVINRSSFEQHDLFRFYLQKKVNDLNEVSNDAVNKHEIKIEGNMIEITSEMYQSAFTGSDDSIFRPMYRCNDNDFFFEGFGKNYFETANNLVKKRQIKKIKRLFVYAENSELDDIRIKKLIYFHNVTNNFECKVLKLNTYDHIKNDYNLNDITGTFAVYGSRYLYTEKTVSTVDHVIGYYSKDPSKISNFTNFFEKCWEQAQPQPVTSLKKITIDDIFNQGWEL
ncbi:MAG: hypothetical protein LBI14_11670 [Treponema sp.]|nr:hypothetical protein [Treponema sp.]